MIFWLGNTVTTSDSAHFYTKHCSCVCFKGNVTLIQGGLKAKATALDKLQVDQVKVTTRQKPNERDFTTICK